MGPPKFPPKRLLSYRGWSGFPSTAFKLSAAFRSRFVKYSYRVPWNWFVPLLMIWLNWPPEEWPYSGENWFAITVNSETASLGTCTNGPVTALLLLSTPSMVKLLLRGRWPPTEGPTPIPIPPLEATPGLSREAFKTPKPVDPPAEVDGRSVSSTLSNDWVRFVLVV